LEILQTSKFGVLSKTYEEGRPRLQLRAGFVRQQRYQSLFNRSCNRIQQISTVAGITTRLIPRLRCDLKHLRILSNRIPPKFSVFRQQFTTDAYSLSNAIVMFLCIIVTLCISCSSPSSNDKKLFEETAVAIWNSPPRWPDYIKSIHFGLGGRSILPKALCIWIDQKPLWDGGFVAEVLTTHIYNSLRIVIDDHAVTKKDIFVADSFAVEYVYDEIGNPIGSYSTLIEVCFNIENVSKGIHLANLSFSNLSETEYAYAWSFCVMGDLASASPETLSTVVALPVFSATPTSSSTLPSGTAPPTALPLTPTMTSIDC